MRLVESTGAGPGAAAIPDARAQTASRLLPAVSRRPLRTIVTSLHRWFGLFAALWLFGIALSGSIIAFHGEIDRALNPDLFSASGRGPLEPVLADAAIRIPGGRVDFVLYHHDVPGLVTLGVRADGDARQQLYYDSGTGAFNGERDAARNGLGRRHFVATVYRLHYSFLGGATLQWFLGLVALGWAVTQVLALLIAFTSLGRWRDSFQVRRAVRGHKRNFDLHRALALWFYPVTLMLAVSGVYMNWPDEFETAVAAFGPVTPGFVAPSEAVGAPPSLAIAEAAERFDQIAAPSRVTSFSYNAKASAYRARMRDARDISDNGQRIVWISGSNGQILHDRHETQGSSGDKFLAWQFPLHSGRALGLPGRLLIATAGVVIMVSIVTGLMIWSKKRRQRRRTGR